MVLRRVFGHGPISLAMIKIIWKFDGTARDRLSKKKRLTGGNLTQLFDIVVF